MSFFSDIALQSVKDMYSIAMNEKQNEQKNTPAPSEKEKITETVKDESEKKAVKSETTISSDEKIKWIELALKYLVKELPYAFPPKVNEKPVITISNENKMIIVSFVPQNQLYATANVTFDYNTKERIAVFATTGAYEKVGINIAEKEVLKEETTSNADLKDFTGINYQSLMQRSTHGDPEATYKLGLVFENGLYGKERDLKKAIECYQRAAKKGYDKAQAKLKELSKSGDDKQTKIVVKARRR